MTDKQQALEQALDAIQKVIDAHRPPVVEEAPAEAEEIPVTEEHVGAWWWVWNANKRCQRLYRGVAIYPNPAFPFRMCDAKIPIAAVSQTPSSPPAPT